MKKIGLYEISVSLFFVVIPVAAVIIERCIISSDISLLILLLKWFTFSGVGLRLFTAGLKQVFQPSFTSRELFKIADKNCLPIIREIGFGNLCMGTIGLLSLLLATFRQPAAVAGGLYLGIAGVQHAIKQRKERGEVFAMITDLYMFVVLCVLIILNL
jgi:hypothetical protein